MSEIIKKAIAKIVGQFDYCDPCTGEPTDYAAGGMKILTKILTDLVEEVEKDKRKAIQAAKAYQELCTHYRIGKTPSEKLFKRLDAANMFLKQIEKELEGKDENITKH